MKSTNRKKSSSPPPFKSESSSCKPGNGTTPETVKLSPAATRLEYLKSKHAARSQAQKIPLECKPATKCSPHMDARGPSASKDAALDAAIEANLARVDKTIEGLMDISSKFTVEINNQSEKLAVMNADVTDISESVARASDRVRVLNSKH
uniref:t-SNARE coiled-coil homology domain-containing protein n=1 Tax=Octactis speculum TaxID=3111310 RepID=A0A7S2AY49_9STRA|mmetsp:Transcript_17342/g.23372  ORF Transcript_17342/g.23372 Transcript_17342/m.23372 type:complete len:150 (+) Transcript_17342:1-450(+)|eukprot:CAMPEP_0185783594 /NCGR_PEP_ID=MMETSP1174-20130828/117947_1 /TAXON_ID=35687 /ORGANISM="Dictyocha speculum, Strain CCMP1381" /LENGTH=149 /DNA_ID=CAMNT_0028474715 /DNA_START=1 /DNA_END=450 /DNA_ORIENTATION=+